MRVRLNKRVIEQAAYQGPGADYRWDTELPSFGLRVYPSGRKSFVVTFRVRGRQRFLTLGRYGEITLYQARTMALEMLGRARRGEDPAAERVAGRAGPTVAELAERFQREHAEVNMKPSSCYQAERCWKGCILPKLGSRKVADIRRSDIAELHTQMAATPVQANYARGLLSTAFNLAEVWGWRPEGTNPCRNIRRYKRPSRERFLSEEELARLAGVLAETERARPEWSPVVAALRLLILTGCRCNEILQLRWDEVDFEARYLRLSDSKTGPRSIPLNATALQVLAGIERIEGNPYVIPGRNEGSHLVQLHGPWTWIRENAGLDGVRLHDLRHTFASFGVGSGLSLPLIGKLLGHSDIGTTQRYAHLADDPVRQAAERIGATLEAAMKGKPKAEVVVMERRKVGP